MLLFVTLGDEWRRWLLYNCASNRGSDGGDGAPSALRIVQAVTMRWKVVQIQSVVMIPIGRRFWRCWSTVAIVMVCHESSRDGDEDNDPDGIA